MTGGGDGMTGGGGDGMTGRGFVVAFAGIFQQNAWLQPWALVFTYPCEF
jgi:hypothetical protein